jgi:uncharacterized protein (TIGR03437 family)
MLSIVNDSQGNVYVADTDNHIVGRISTSGVLTIVAGSGIPGFSGDGGPAADAALDNPSGLAIDGAGNLFILDKSNGRIRKVSTDGTITTVAGNGATGYAGDGGPAINASFNLPSGIVADAAGNLYIADYINCRVRKVTTDGIVNTIAGTGVPNYTGDGGPATSAGTMFPDAVGVDAAGNVYVSTGNRIRKITTDGIINTFAGTADGGYSGDGGPALKAAIGIPSSIVFDAAGNLYTPDRLNNNVRKITPDGVITTVVGNGGKGFGGDGGPAKSALVNTPFSATVDPSGNIFVADTFNFRVRKVGSDSNIGTVAGNATYRYTGDGGNAISATLVPAGVATDSSGNLYIADTGNNRIRKVTSAGIISTIVGNGLPSFSGDGGPAINAGLSGPRGVFVDAGNNLYIADTGNNRIRKVTPNGAITTFAGLGPAGFSGDNGPANKAQLFRPYAMVVDGAGNVIIADSWNNRIRKVTPDGNITTIAGNGYSSFGGDGGPATSAALFGPFGVAVDRGGNIYIADINNFRIRKVTPTGAISTIAGAPIPGFAGDGGPASHAQFDSPYAVAVDGAGNLFVSDISNHRIRKIDTSGTISTVAGDGDEALSGDGGLATNASLDSPAGIALDPSGNLFIADSGNTRIRAVVNASTVSFKVAPSSLTFSAVSGGSSPAAQSIALSPSVTGISFTAASDSPWLSVSPAAGAMPVSLQVSVDPSQLNAGTYSGNITITAPDTGATPVSVAVSLTLDNGAPPQLSVGTTTLVLASLTGGAPISQQVQIVNSGGGTLTFMATATTASGGGWLSLSTAVGTATPGLPASLTVTANPGSLSAGTYSGTVSITDGQSTFNISVSLLITDPKRFILLSQSGLTFTAVAQAGTPLPQSFGVLNTGQGSMDWSASATTLSGGSWLSISPTSGTVQRPFLDVSNVDVSIDQTGLDPGEYYGRIQVNAAADNTPQLITVILTVLPAGQNPGPEVRPTGLIFTGLAGSTPGSQNVMLGDTLAQPNPFDSGTAPRDPRGFSYLPTTAKIVPSQPSILRVFPDFSNLQPGEINHEAITLVFDDGSIRSIGVLTVVAPSASSSFRSGLFPLASGNCSTLNFQWRNPSPPNVTVAQGRGLTLEVQVIDSCGNLVGPSNPKSASVTAWFSNKDPDLTLVHVGNGVWTATWKPVNMSTGPVTITVNALSSTGNVLQAGQAPALFATVAPSNTPLVTAGGVQHGASFVLGAPIAPGTLITLKGLNLANTSSTSTDLPLPTNVNGTQVFMGTEPLPLLFTATGQVNVQIPYDVPVNTQFQVSVQRDNVQSLPEQLLIAAAQPGVFTVDASGSGQGVIFKSDGGTLAQPVACNTADYPCAPANAGETITIQCTGLGVVSPPVPAGTPPPDSPISSTVNPVSVTIGGLDAQATVGALIPGRPGVYQVKATVPNGVTGDALPVVVTVAGQSSPAVTMSVQ